jgi:O-antigen ligase
MTDRIVALLCAVALVGVYLLPSQSGASFATYVLAVTVLVSGRDRWRAFAQQRLLAGLFVALLGYFAASVWWSAEWSLRGTFSVYSRCVLMATFVAALATSLVRVPEFQLWLVRAVAIAGAIAAGAALIGLWRHPTWDGRLVGFGQLRSSVVAALAFAASWVFAADMALSDASRWRVVGAACAAVIVLAIFETGSRAGYLSAAVGLWTLVVFKRWPSARGRVVWLVLPIFGAAVAGAIALLAADGAPSPLFPRGDSFRFEIWAAEWQRLQAAPVFGLGILTGDAVALEGRTFVHPHSLYLSAALQGGLVGLLLLSGVLGCAAWGLIHGAQRRIAQLGLALLVAGASGYAFDGWELIDKVGLSWLLLWVPVAVALAVGTSEGNTRDMVNRDSPARCRCTDGSAS